MAEVPKLSGETKPLSRLSACHLLGLSQCMSLVQFVQSHLPYGGGNGVLVLESSVPALVFLAVGNDLVNVAVGCHKGRKQEEEREHVDGIQSE